MFSQSVENIHVERQKENGKILVKSLALKLRDKKFKDGLFFFFLLGDIPRRYSLFKYFLVQSFYSSIAHESARKTEIKVALEHHSSEVPE